MRLATDVGQTHCAYFFNLTSYIYHLPQLFRYGDPLLPGNLPDESATKIEIILK